MSVHRGEILEKAVRTSGMSIVEIAKKFGTSQRHMYNLFKRENVPFEALIRFGKIIHHDFSNDIPELRKLYKVSELNAITEEDVEKYHSNLKDTLLRCMEEKDNLKNKIIALQEEKITLINQLNKMRMRNEGELNF